MIGPVNATCFCENGRNNTKFAWCSSCLIGVMVSTFSNDYTQIFLNFNYTISINNSTNPTTPSTSNC